jgi:hypothetical protein
MRVESGIFKWPNGTTLPVSVPPKLSSDNYLLVRYPYGHPEQAQAIYNLTTKESLFRKLFHYYVSKANSGAQCRGCAKLLDPKELCIQSQIICIL